MKPVQITMDPDLLARLDAQVEVRRRGRSAIIREAVEAWLRERRHQDILEGYRRGYGKDPGLGEEWDGWEDQGTWPEDGE